MISQSASADLRVVAGDASIRRAVPVIPSMLMRNFVLVRMGMREVAMTMLVSVVIPGRDWMYGKGGALTSLYTRNSVSV